MVLLGDIAQVPLDPATILGQWVGIAVGLITLGAVATGIGINLNKLKTYGRDITQLRIDLALHSTEDKKDFEVLGEHVRAVSTNVDVLKLGLASQGVKFMP